METEEHWTTNDDESWAVAEYFSRYRSNDLVAVDTIFDERPFSNIAFSFMSCQ